MDKKRSIESSLKELEELAKRIGRSQQSGHPLPSGITRGWEITMNSHLGNIRRRLGIEVETAAPTTSLNL